MVQPPRAPEPVAAPAQRRAPLQSPTGAQIRFRSALTRSMRREWVTELIVALNVGVYLWMVVRGVDLLMPDAQTLVAWGANYGPLTRGPEVWRLASSTFLHGGLIHLGFNMYALMMAGRMVERVFGHVGYALLYAFAGLVGSAASAFVNPLGSSVGASGAVFGVFGALLAFLLRRRALFPAEVLKPLRFSVLGFVVFNALFGFAVPGIDNAAHLGGLTAGFVGALLIAPSISSGTGEEATLRRPFALYPLIVAAGAGAVWLVSTMPIER